MECSCRCGRVSFWCFFYKSTILFNYSHTQNTNTLKYTFPSFGLLHAAVGGYIYQSIYLDTYICIYCVVARWTAIYLCMTPVRTFVRSAKISLRIARELHTKVKSYIHAARPLVKFYSGIIGRIFGMRENLSSHAVRNCAWWDAMQRGSKRIAASARKNEIQKIYKKQ